VGRLVGGSEAKRSEESVGIVGRAAAFICSRRNESETTRRPSRRTRRNGGETTDLLVGVLEEWALAEQRLRVFPGVRGHRARFACARGRSEIPLRFRPKWALNFSVASETRRAKRRARVWSSSLLTLLARRARPHANAREARARRAASARPPPSRRRRLIAMAAELSQARRRPRITQTRHLRGQFIIRRRFSIRPVASSSSSSHARRPSIHPSPRFSSHPRVPRARSGTSRTNSTRSGSTRRWRWSSARGSSSRRTTRRDSTRSFACS